MQRQRVHGAAHLGGKGSVDLLMPSDAGTPLKIFTDQHHFKVRFGVGGYAVLITFIGDIHIDRRKTLLKLSLNILLNHHEKTYSELLTGWTRNIRLYQGHTIGTAPLIHFCELCDWRETGPASVASTF